MSHEGRSIASAASSFAIRLSILLFVVGLVVSLFLDGFPSEREWVFLIGGLPFFYGVAFITLFFALLALVKFKPTGNEQ